jgi:fatty-acid peroxygenase
MPTDLGLSLLASGYRAIPEQRARAGGQSDFCTRLLGRHTLVLRGIAGVRRFYDPSVVERHRAVPLALAGLIFGPGAVHGLDGAAHLLRKRMFLEVLTRQRSEQLARLAAERLAAQVHHWPARDQVAVVNELGTAYGFAVLEWAGVECSAAEAHGVVGDLARIIDGFGGAGRAWPRGWRARLAMDRWAARLVRHARAGRRRPDTGTALQVIAASDLPARRAGVELLNVLRPTVAVAWLGAFAVLALHRHPEWRARMSTDAEAFTHEVRRLAPFVPALTGLAARPFDHAGTRHPKGTRLVLDVPGTNRDPARWEDPDAFRPERFLDGPPDPWSYVPQGGGYADAGHRCPGEPATVALLAATMRLLADVDFDVVDGRYDERRIPTVPHGGLRLVDVRIRDRAEGGRRAHP